MRHGLIDKQAALAGNPRVVGFEEIHVGPRVRGVARLVGGVVPDLVRHRIDLGVIEGIGLNDPGRLIVFLKRVLQGLFQRIAHRCQVFLGAARRPDRVDLKHGAHRVAILQQHRLVII